MKASELRDALAGLMQKHGGDPDCYVRFDGMDLLPVTGVSVQRDFKHVDIGEPAIMLVPTSAAIIIE